MKATVLLGWRVIEYRDGNVLSLFHGTQRSRILKLDQWNKADKKMVTDGSNAKAYESGYHFFETYQEAFEFLRRLRVRDNRYVISVAARGNIRKKNNKVWLADEMYIESNTYLYSVD